MKNGAARRLAPKRRVPYRKAPARSTLAPGTIEGRAAALDDPFHRSATGARLPLSVINREALREIAELAVGRGEIAQCRSARGDRFGKYVVNRRHQAPEATQRDRTAGPGGMNARAIERLADIDIAETRDDPLIEEQELDCGTAPGEAALQLLGCDVQGLRAKRFECRPIC